MKTTNIWQYEIAGKIQRHSLAGTDMFSASLFLLQQGHQIPPHISSTGAMVLVLEGRIAFMLNETVSVLVPGDVISFGANEIHALQALEDARFLLVK